MALKPIEDLSIRVIDKNDRALVEAFFAQMGEESASFFNVNRGNEKTALAYIEGKLPYHLYFMAIDEAENKPAGIAFIWDKNTSVPWFGIAIAEEYKGRRLGGRLIETVRAYCEAQGMGGILLTTAKDNLRGQRLYERCGFERFGMHENGELLYLLRFTDEK